MATKKEVTKPAEHEHEYELLYIVDKIRESNIGHYVCKCGSRIVRARGNDGNSK